MKIGNDLQALLDTHLPTVRKAGRVLLHVAGEMDVTRERFVQDLVARGKPGNLHGVRVGPKA